VNGWLKGENDPTLDNLHNLVDEFAAKVTWLDTADSWKARFTVARVNDTSPMLCWP
jgi:hypothetical protein